MISKSATKHRLAMVLVLPLVASAAHGQSTTERPQELTIRDNQGKLVTVPPGNPAKRVDYIRWLDQTMSQGITDNAADTYAEAYELYNAAKLEDEDLDQALAGPWKDLPAISAWLEANQACLDKFQQATLKRQCFFHPTAPNEQLLSLALMPSLATHRMICKALLAEGWQAWRQGRRDQLIDNLVTIQRTVEHLRAQVTMIENFVAGSLTEQAEAALRTAMTIAPDPDAFARRLTAKLTTRVDAPFELPSGRWLIVEFIAMRDMAQRQFEPGDQPGTWRPRPGLQAELDSAQAQIPGIEPPPKDFEQRLAQAGYEGTIRAIDNLAHRAQIWLRQPWHEVAAGKDSYAALLAETKNPLIEMMGSDFDRARELMERGIAYRRASRLIVQLHVHHGQHHSFPKRLDHLATKELKELRIDPFSGRDFGYQVKGEGFILYSVAENGKDDGGRHGQSWAEDDFVFWPVPPQKKP